MGNRFFGRKKILRWKQQQKHGDSPDSTTASVNLGQSPSEDNGHGHIWCKPDEHYVSIDVCFVRQTRTPGKCKLCGYFKEVA